MNFINKTKKYFLKKNLYKAHKGAGFTLIETMVAITILLVTIVGPMEIASKALFSAFYARDQITAYYLAQEGIESLRNFRDVYYLNGFTGWPSFVTDCSYDGISKYGCKVGASSGANPVYSVLKCTAKCDTPSDALYYNSGNGIYSYITDSGNTKSKYTRLVKVTPDATNPNDAALVESTVYWTGSYLSSGTKSFTIKEMLYNWQTK